MKKLLFLFLITIGLSKMSLAQEPLGLPGDNLNLYSVLNLFQKSPTLESFEKNLNIEDYKLNNLDLNVDGRTDYIHVIDHIRGEAHIIVLKVNINQYESQDIAVIEVEKINNQIHVQIVGDEELYGKDYIVEPNDQLTTNPGYDGETTYTPPVSSWVIFNYMYNPYYIGYSSPYYWGYYPYYWNAWTPMYYDSYYSYHRPYYNYYRRGYYYRSPAAHGYYSPRRTTSVTVINRRGGAYQTPHQNRPQNNYQQSRPNNYQQHNNQQSRPNNYQQSRPNNQQARPNNYQQSRPNNQPRQNSSPSNRSSGGKKTR